MMSKVYGRGGQKRKIFSVKKFFFTFQKISLVKVVQNKKFLLKKCCQKIDLSKNDNFET